MHSCTQHSCTQHSCTQHSCTQHSCTQHTYTHIHRNEQARAESRSPLFKPPDSVISHYICTGAQVKCSSQAVVNLAAQQETDSASSNTSCQEPRDSSKAREEIQVQILLGMRIPNMVSDDCRRALKHCQWKIDRAAGWLVERSEELDHYKNERSFQPFLGYISCFRSLLCFYNGSHSKYTYTQLTMSHSKHPPVWFPAL